MSRRCAAVVVALKSTSSSPRSLTRSIGQLARCRARSARALSSSDTSSGYHAGFRGTTSCRAHAIDAQVGRHETAIRRLPRAHMHDGDCIRVADYRSPHSVRAAHLRQTPHRSLSEALGKPGRQAPPLCLRRGAGGEDYAFFLKAVMNSASFWTPSICIALYIDARMPPTER